MAPGFSSLVVVVLFLGTVAGVGVLLLAARGRLAALTGFRRGRRLQLLERMDLGERRFVALVRVDERELLLGGGSQGVSLLAGEPLFGGVDPGAADSGESTPALVRLPAPARREVS